MSAPGTPSGKRQIEAAAMPVRRVAARAAPCMRHRRLYAIGFARRSHHRTARSQAEGSRSPGSTSEPSSSRAG